jgi:hypothetical protein
MKGASGYYSRPTEAKKPAFNIEYPPCIAYPGEVIMVTISEDV